MKQKQIRIVGILSKRSLLLEDQNSAILSYEDDTLNKPETRIP